MSAKIAHDVELNRAEVPTRPPAGPFTSLNLQMGLHNVLQQYEIHKA